MFRALLVTLVILAANSSIAFSQVHDTTTDGHHGTSVLFEATIGARLDRYPDQVSQDRGHVSWELGPSFNRGDWAWGATIMAAVDDDGPRWGIRARYRRWLGPIAALDFGAGILLGGQGGQQANYGDQHYPGFAGLIGLSYGNWLGVNLELQTIPTTRISPDYHMPSQALYVPGTRTESTDWAWIIAARLSGSGAIALSAAEGFLLMIALGQMYGS